MGQLSNHRNQTFKVFREEFAARLGPAVDAVSVPAFVGNSELMTVAADHETTQKTAGQLSLCFFCEVVIEQTFRLF